MRNDTWTLQKDWFKNDVSLYLRRRAGQCESSSSAQAEAFSSPVVTIVIIIQRLSTATSVMYEVEL